MFGQNHFQVTGSPNGHHPAVHQIHPCEGVSLVLTLYYGTHSI